MIRWLAVLFLALVSVGVRAEPAAPLPPVEKQSLDDFAAANASCHEWSDGCVVCVRQDKASDQAADHKTETSAFACSTPGIACTPTRLACRAPAPAPKP